MCSDSEGFKKKEKNRTLKLSEQVSRIFDQCADDAGSAAAEPYGGNLACSGAQARRRVVSYRLVQGGGVAVVWRHAHCRNYVADVSSNV